MPQKFITITEVVKQTGIPASTLRYYEEIGLIQSSGRHGIMRVFKAKVVQQLSLILLGQAADFSLDEISDMALKNSSEIDRQKLLEKSEQVDNKIKQLTKLRDGLIHAAHCSAPSHLECPKFQRLLSITQKDKKRKLQRKAN
ncbi:helix-turn-helix domain-containing protein [Paraglaciecola marina]|uniref:helix-turn-helix domain-containing protein n=1 Tax=Paraglaciecola marina TaxID=2500157 RepID=UPI003B82C7D2